MASIVTLLTDFGTKDHFVGVLKGVILGVSPHINIVDITHQVTPFAVCEAAFLTRAAYAYFPKGSVHLAVVDPGVGTDRELLIVEADGHTFVAPDNGFWEVLLANRAVKTVVCIDQEHKYLAQERSATFAGRDTLAPVAAYLANGAAPSRLGQPMDRADFAERLGRAGVGALPGAGQVLHIDNFGNVVTSLRGEQLPERFDIRVAGVAFAGPNPTFAALAPAVPGAILGSAGYLELVLNQGNAALVYGIKVGDRVELSSC